jgi:predicted phage terminase large subunit-like protein
MVDGWALDAMCQHLEAITFGDLTEPRLLMNVSPGFMKSLLTQVFWPAWEWSAMDLSHHRYVTFSYSATLTERDNGYFRDLVCSDKFKQLWGHRFEITTIGVQRVANDKTGWKLASSVGGVGTGERGDRVIVDDPHNIKEGESEVIRTETVRWFQEAAENRLNDLNKSAIVVIMQRVHEMDVAGAILKAGNYVHLMIPMEFEPGRACRTVIGWRDPRKEDGELAWPERFPESTLNVFKQRAYMWASQYQQRPEPRGGGIFKRHWWRNWNDETCVKMGVKPGHLPSFSYMLGVLDTAYTEKEENDPSAMTVWGVFPDQNGAPNVMLVHSWEEWLEFNPLIEKTAKVARDMHLDRLLIESKASGLSIAQELVRRFSGKGFSIEAVDPAKGDKISRAIAQTYAFEEGLVWAPGYPDGRWRKTSERVIEQMATFPRSTHKDLTDTATMALYWLRAMGLILRGEEKESRDREQMMHRGRQSQRKLYDA